MIKMLSFNFFIHKKATTQGSQIFVGRWEDCHRPCFIMTQQYKNANSCKILTKIEVFITINKN